MSTGSDERGGFFGGPGPARPSMASVFKGILRSDDSHLRARTFPFWDKEATKIVNNCEDAGIMSTARPRPRENKGSIFSPRNRRRSGEVSCFFTRTFHFGFYKAGFATPRNVPTKFREKLFNARGIIKR